MNVLNGLKLLGVVLLSVAGFAGIVTGLIRLPFKVSAFLFLSLLLVGIFLAGAFTYE